MNKKGFTLIELLAVIVILAIIALITAPIILGVIENARKDSAKDKAWGTINAVELAYTQDQVKDSTYKIGTPVDFSNKPALVGSAQVKASGELPTSGTVTIRDDGSIIAQNLKFDSYTCSTVKSETDNTIDPNNMICAKSGDLVTPIPSTQVVYRHTADRLKIGDSIEGITTTTDPSTLGKNHYLKHEIEDNKITASYVCFVIDEEHCMQGGNSSYMKTNYALLLGAFGEGTCNVNDSGTSDPEVRCDASGVYASAFSSGRVYAYVDSSSCSVSSGGNSYCEVFK